MRLTNREVIATLSFAAVAACSSAHSIKQSLEIDLPETLRVEVPRFAAFDIDVRATELMRLDSVTLVSSDDAIVRVKPGVNVSACAQPYTNADICDAVLRGELECRQAGRATITAIAVGNERGRVTEARDVMEVECVAPSGVGGSGGTGGGGGTGGAGGSGGTGGGGGPLLPDVIDNVIDLGNGCWEANNGSLTYNTVVGSKIEVDYEATLEQAGMLASFANTNIGGVDGVYCAVETYPNNGVVQLIDYGTVVDSDNFTPIAGPNVVQVHCEFEPAVGSGAMTVTPNGGSDILLSDSGFGPETDNTVQLSFLAGGPPTRICDPIITLTP